MVWPHGLFADFVNPFRLDIICIFALIVLEIPGPNAAPGVGCPPDKRGSQRPLGLIHLGACDLIDKALVIFQGIDGMGYFDIQRPPHGDGLEVF